MSGNVAMHLIAPVWHTALHVTGPDAAGVVTRRCRNDCLDHGHIVEVEQRLQFRSAEVISADLARAGLLVTGLWCDWRARAARARRTSP